MICRYKNMNININDRILKGDKDCRNQLINEQFIQYAIAISIPNNFPEELLTEQNISDIIHQLIIADIGDIIGYEYWTQYGIEAYEDKNGKIIWREL